MADQQEETKNNQVNDFVREYGELVAKYKKDFAQFPVFVPDGNGGFRVVIQNSVVDISDAPVKSPFVAS